MNIAIIPARGGSKRIPRKNIRIFCGKPIIAWSIEAAITSGLFTHIIVSTDDAEIAQVARQWKAEVPFMRSPELSDDHIGTQQVMRHALQWLAQHGVHADLTCCIYATAPFVRSEDLHRGLAALTSGNWRYAFSVTHYAFPVQRALRRLENGGVAMVEPSYEHSRSQDLPEIVHDAGQFYWGYSQAFLNIEPVFSDHSIPVLLPRHRVQDIDTLDDWRRAELMHEALRREGTEGDSR